MKILNQIMFTWLPASMALFLSVCGFAGFWIPNRFGAGMPFLLIAGMIVAEFINKLDHKEAEK
jgi:hypothetical protein